MLQPSLPHVALVCAACLRLRCAPRSPVRPSRSLRTLLTVDWQKTAQARARVRDAIEQALEAEAADIDVHDLH